MNMITCFFLSKFSVYNHQLLAFPKYPFFQNNSSALGCQIRFPALCSAAEQIIPNQKEQQAQQDTPEDVRNDQPNKNTGCHTEKGVTDQSFHSYTFGLFSIFYAAGTCLIHR